MVSLYGLVTPTYVYGVSGLPQAFLFFLDMRLLKKVCVGHLLSIFGQCLVNNCVYWSYTLGDIPIPLEQINIIDPNKYVIEYVFQIWHCI